MKKALKLRCSGFSIVLLLVAIMSSTGIKGVTEANIEDYLEKDCESVSDYIESNFSTFVSEYNEATEEEWLATSIEYRKPVINVTDNTSAIYLDFDGDNGYAVVGNDYNFLDFSQSGDLEYLKELEVVLFSEYDGFVYETKNGFARYSVTYADEDYWNNVKLGRYYTGQKQDKGEGSGRITNPDAYIKDRYGSDFNLETNKRLTGYKNVTQNSYNNYTKDGKGEGNCTLSAMFGIMQYLRDYKSMSKLPSTTTTIDPTKDSFYKELTGDGYSAYKVTVPSIYAMIRNKAINYGYKASSGALTSINMANIYMDVMNAYGYNNNILRRYAYMVLVWSFESQVKREIDAGYPTMWNTARGQYGSHSVVVNGYRRYYKNHKIWFIKWKEYKNLMSLNDNWGSADIYFDLDAYGCNLWSEGFGTFVQVRNYTY